MVNVTINPRNSALLIQDMQNDIVKSNRPIVPMGGPQLIENCQKLLTRARQLRMPVIYVRVSCRPDL
jgi:nicotinamidase-related amidase